jgi:hypothetical protein
MRSYQILTIVGSLFVIYDLIFSARQLSISVLVVNVLLSYPCFFLKTILNLLALD